MIGARPWLQHGDCIEWLGLLPSASVDACVSDPPYGLGNPPDPVAVMRAWAAGEEFRVEGGGFMGRVWDSFVPGPEMWKQVFRVLKPGGHVVAFASTRTVGWTEMALRFAGFEIRDQIDWLYWSGFPKSLDVSKAIDKDAGIWRGRSGSVVSGNSAMSGPNYERTPKGSPETDDARQWEGWGTALKPCFEPAVLARKPLDGTVAETILAHGTGGINIAACSFKPGSSEWPGPNDPQKPSAAAWSPGHPGDRFGKLDYDDGEQWLPPEYGRHASNILYVPKPSRRERERGTSGIAPLETPAVEAAGLGSKGLDSPRAGAGRKSEPFRNNHPTLKPVRLMRWLCRLTCPQGGVVIDPFTGSGTTGIAAILEGMRFGGAELDERFHMIASSRITHARLSPGRWEDTAPGTLGPR